MSGNFSDFLEQKLLNHVFGSPAYSQPAGLFLALFTTATDDTSGSGTEVSGNAYARQAIAFGSAASPAGTISNSGVVTFPTATPAGWGTITDFGIYDAVTGGNRLVYGTLTASQTIAAGNRLEFAAAALVISLD